ncbi:MFS transporter [Corynebacterium epidermidicanis]|uniref:Major Facilitator Superfamily transporter n=1 Tax=Corynebacterium epidermidicanis TaxID=1050174 RepID=A0A0G3GMZ2_9CORY|nr:MFS transporter [Corynebacterium epidermidicanis]AKK01915.1 Major Facilitator Superfamily transporter [Corynebacterium epidermidicanis]
MTVALQQTLLVPAVPVLPAQLGVSSTVVSWAVTSTLLTGAIATPIISKLSDNLGRRRMLLLAMAITLLGSILAPLGGATLLIIGRALQGVGTALVPVAMAQMRDSLPAHRVPGALSILSATLGVGGGIGIPLGGAITAAFNWQALFVVSALLSAASMALIIAVLPATAPRQGHRFDFGGAVLLSLGLVALLLGISQGNAWGWGSFATIGAFLVALLALAAWGAIEVRVADPLVDLKTSAIQQILLTNIASFLMGLLMFTNLLSTTIELQNPVARGGFGWSTTAAGMAMLPNALAMFVVAPLTSNLARRIPANRILIIGAVVTALGYALRLIPVTSGFWLVGWATIIGFGVGIGYAALPMLIVRYAPSHQIGEANGVNALVRAIGTAVASSMVATIVAAFADSGSINTAVMTISIVAIIVAIITMGVAYGAQEGSEE